MSNLYIHLLDNYGRSLILSLTLYNKSSFDLMLAEQKQLI